MKKNVRAFAAAAAVALGIGALGVAPASAKEPNPSQTCDLFLEEVIEEGTGAEISHGACVAIVAAGNPVPLFVSVCKSPDAIELFEEFFGVDIPEQNVGQCVKFLKGFLARGGAS